MSVVRFTQDLLQHRKVGQGTFNAASTQCGQRGTMTNLGFQAERERNRFICCDCRGETALLTVFLDLLYLRLKIL